MGRASREAQQPFPSGGSWPLRGRRGLATQAVQSWRPLQAARQWQPSGACRVVGDVWHAMQWRARHPVTALRGHAEGAPHARCVAGVALHSS